MPIQRHQIIKGPALVEFRGSKFFSKGDIQLSLSYDTFNVESSAHGKLDERATSRRAEVSFDPVGEWEALDVLWPYGAFQIGKSIFNGGSYGGADGSENTLVIHTVAGVKITMPAAAVTRMPDLELSAQRTLIGGVTFTCIGKDNTAWSAAQSFIKVESVMFPSGAGAGLGAIDLTKIKTVPYSAAWGASSPWDAIKTVGGWRIGFDMQTRPIETDDDGVVDMIFENLGVTARAQPLGISEEDLVTALTIQGTGAYRGASLQAIGGERNLVIQGPAALDPKITLTKCAIKQSGLGFGPATPRVGELQWIATRSFTNGVPDALFTVASV